jgi:hypothetical protein
MHAGSIIRQFTTWCDEGPRDRPGVELPRMWGNKMTTLAGIAAAWLVTIALVFSTASSAQEATTRDGAQDCKFQAKGFERRPGPIHEITAKFILKPASGADAAQLKRHVIYSHLLGRVSSDRVFKTSLRRCTFGTEIGVTLDLRFQLFNINQNIHDECSLGYCARLLSGEIQSLDIDQQTFSNAIDSVVEAGRRRDSLDLRWPLLSADRAVGEAYRHIYPPGARGRIFDDVWHEDYERMAFDDFAGWFKQQQSRLRSFEPMEAPSPRAETSFPDESRGRPGCEPARRVDVQELNIEHHGWGHRALIMIKSGYTREGRTGIDNAVLRGFCHPDEGHPDGLDAPPWREMAGELQCFRRLTLGGDRWLVLYSSKPPAKTSAEMLRFARGMAQTLEADGCIAPDLRLLVINFLKQD